MLPSLTNHHPGCPAALSIIQVARLHCPLSRLPGCTVHYPGCPAALSIIQVARLHCPLSRLHSCTVHHYPDCLATVHNYPDCLASVHYYFISFSFMNYPGCLAFVHHYPGCLAPLLVTMHDAWPVCVRDESCSALVWFCCVSCNYPELVTPHQAVTVMSCHVTHMCHNKVIQLTR
ncbi:hypothetical protein V1264_024123 [Littorina saxatilis]|uniref:Uncharacterized protein n=1 Tax=Littorina saxatilis TaxID=31220 RepID=A0AAN9BA18_9CAEN